MLKFCSYNKKKNTFIILCVILIYIVFFYNGVLDSKRDLFKSEKKKETSKNLNSQIFANNYSLEQLNKFFILLQKRETKNSVAKQRVESEVLKIFSFEEVKNFISNSQDYKFSTANGNSFLRLHSTQIKKFFKLSYDKNYIEATDLFFTHLSNISMHYSFKQPRDKPVREELNLVRYFMNFHSYFTNQFFPS